MRIGIITGLEMEADIVRRAASKLADQYHPLVAAALGPAGAGEAAKKMIDEGATALLSFGFAGALDGALKTGQIVVSGLVYNENGEALESGLEWFSGALNLLDDFGAEHADLLTTGSVIADVDAKARLRATSGAGAVDMESFGVARVAHEVGVPFIAIRVILDTASQAIPPSALAGMDENGVIMPGRALRHLLSRPGDLAPLIGLAMASRKAKRVLSRVAGLGLPAFGLSPSGGLG